MTPLSPSPDLNAPPPSSDPNTKLRRKRWTQSVVGATRESTVSVRVASSLFDVVERLGGSRDEVLEGSRLRVEHLDDPDARIPRSVMHALCERALDVTGEPALGLRWSERIDDASFVPVSHLIAHAGTLREGLHSLQKFYRLVSDHQSYELVEQGAGAIVKVAPLTGESPRLQRLINEMLVVGFYKLLRSLGTHATPRRVAFAYPAPRYQVEYATLLGREVYFEQPFTGLVFDGALLDQPSPRKDPDVHDALQALAQRRLLKLTQRTSYASRVREFLVRQGGPYRTDMEEAARAVGLSVRSLRRRLEAEGMPYGVVAQEALLSVAKHLLLDDRRTIQEIAYVMGYSDARAFHRAFRRWTGTTPSIYRRELL